MKPKDMESNRKDNGSISIMSCVLLNFLGIVDAAVCDDVCGFALWAICVKINQWVYVLALLFLGRGLIIVSFQGQVMNERTWGILDLSYAFLPSAFAE